MALPKSILRAASGLLEPLGFIPQRAGSFTRTKPAWRDHVLLDPLIHTPKAFTVLLALSVPAVDEALKGLDVGPAPVFVVSRFLGSHRAGESRHQVVYFHADASPEAISQHFAEDFQTDATPWFEAFNELSAIAKAIENEKKANQIRGAIRYFLLLAAGHRDEAVSLRDSLLPLLRASKNPLERELAARLHGPVF